MVKYSFRHLVNDQLSNFDANGQKDTVPQIGKTKPAKSARGASLIPQMPRIEEMSILFHWPDHDILHANIRVTYVA